MDNYQKYISEHANLFWSVSPANKQNISDVLLVETILNYGTLDDVKGLFELLGLEKTAQVFFDSTQNRDRHNYFLEVENFFRLYFNRHAPRNPI